MMCMHLIDLPLFGTPLYTVPAYRLCSTCFEPPSWGIPIPCDCATLPGRTPQGCGGSSREGTSGGALAVLQHIQLQNPHTRRFVCAKLPGGTPQSCRGKSREGTSFVCATLPGRTPQSCGGSSRERASGGALAVLEHIPTSEPPRPSFLGTTLPGRVQERGGGRSGREGESASGRREMAAVSCG